MSAMSHLRVFSLKGSCHDKHHLFQGDKNASYTLCKLHLDRAIPGILFRIGTFLQMNLKSEELA